MIKKCAFYFTVILLSVISVPVLFGQQNQKPDALPLKVQPVPLAGFKNLDIGNPSIAGVMNVAKDGNRYNYRRCRTFGE